MSGENENEFSVYLYDEKFYPNSYCVMTGPMSREDAVGFARDLNEEEDDDISQSHYFYADKARSQRETALMHEVSNLRNAIDQIDNFLMARYGVTVFERIPELWDDYGK